MFTAKFQPAKNKKGLSKLTFIGTDVLEGEKEGKPWSMFKFRFLCMGKFHGSDQEISLTTGFQYEPDNLLGKALAAMGFETPNPNTVLDDDGFEVVEPENLDDDGFEVTEAPKLDVMGFLDTKIDSLYVAKLSKNQKNFWAIDVDTLRPFVNLKPTNGKTPNPTNGKKADNESSPNPTNGKKATDEKASLPMTGKKKS